MKSSLTAVKLLGAFLTLCSLVIFLLPINAGASNIPPGFLDTLIDDEPAPWPKYATDHQLELMQLSDPPAGGAEMAGEKGKG